LRAHTLQQHRRLVKKRAQDDQQTPENRLIPNVYRALALLFKDEISFLS